MDRILIARPRLHSMQRGKNFRASNKTQKCEKDKATKIALYIHD